ncbi:glycosyltransferase family 4 protein [Streptomyces montanus]|uniref:D-inositol 3-phosphate glycosyltransferase n=1 Tax=Streptomyces montanus TaxID=2580423 RepID=A0A5R9FWR6_9ACTN|nr:glycosyltransferase [Streptomyces montanus]TLS46426.1 glycosyltransferase family 4 protein [Streptomyces montanus]
MVLARARRPRALYLAYYFPPSRASGVYRARATANYLARRDWDVTVFACPMDFLDKVIGSKDEELLGTLDPRIRIERPPLNQYIWQRDARDFGPLRRRFPHTAQKGYAWTQRRLFPEHYASWSFASVRRAVALHMRRRFDVVVATGNPFSSFAAAWLFRRITGVPYVLDYRDSWTLNQFTDELARPEGDPVHTWERRVTGGAAEVVFVNEAMRAWHAERHPHAADRMTVVPNAWDADLLDLPPLDLSVPAAPRPIRFTFLGTVTAVQPVEEMLSAFRMVRRHADFSDAELHIHGHLGFFKGADAALRGRLQSDADDGRDSGVRLRGPVPKTEVADVYRESDVLVFLTGGARYVTSGKIFEYMATGRPIVSVHGPGIAAEEVLDGYPLWFNANSLDPSALADTMISAAKAARDLSPEEHLSARRHADTYERDVVLAPFETRLRTLARRAS